MVLCVTLVNHLPLVKMRNVKAVGTGQSFMKILSVRAPDGISTIGSLLVLSVFFFLSTMTPSAQDATEIDAIGIDTSSNQWVKIYNEKDTVTFSYRNRSWQVHEVFLDRSFCVIIYSDKYHFVLSAAYKNSVNGAWVVDYPYQKWSKHNPTSAFTTSVHDLQIID